MLGDIQRLSDPGDPSWAVGWDKKTSRGPFSPQLWALGSPVGRNRWEWGLRRKAVPLFGHLNVLPKQTAQILRVRPCSGEHPSGERRVSPLSLQQHKCGLAPQKTAPETGNSGLNYQLCSTEKASFTIPHTSPGFWCNGPANANTRALILFWQEEQEQWVKSSQKNRQNCNSPMDKTNLFFQAACSSMVWIEWNPTIANIFRCLYEQKDVASFWHPGTATADNGVSGIIPTPDIFEHCLKPDCAWLSESISHEKYLWYSLKLPNLFHFYSFIVLQAWKFLRECVVKQKTECK